MKKTLREKIDELTVERFELMKEYQEKIKELDEKIEFLEKKEGEIGENTSA